MAKLKKAYIQPQNGSNTKAIEVLFNPAEYTVEKGNQFQSNALPGLAAPLHQFVNGNADSLTMDLFFDTFTDKQGDVTKKTQLFAKLLDIDAKIHAPPLVKFVWGRFQFKAIIERLSQKFTMFLDDGTPVRATLSVTFKEYKTVAEQLKEVGFQSADVTKRRVLGENEGLWWVAHEEYRDPDRWRLIAEANEIDNPRLLAIGRQLRLPPVTARPAAEVE